MSKISFNSALEQAPEPTNNTGGLFASLKKTRQLLRTDIRELIKSQRGIDAAVLEEIETRLIMADVGTATTEKVMNALNQDIGTGAVSDFNSLILRLRDLLLAPLQSIEHRLEINKKDSPTCILMVGINGAGKTTTTGKMARRFVRQGYSVMLAAGDTFRAAAVEQLQEWGARNNVPVVAQAQGADAASVSFDAMQSAVARQTNILIADTAGRLHTQAGLMAELAKIKRVIQKVRPAAHIETLLVLDASLGQNALNQAAEFHQHIDLSGLVLTKLDGTAKGGIVFALCEKFALPIRFIGTGEGLDDIGEFMPRQFVNALLADGESA